MADETIEGRLEFLRRIPLFSGLPEDALEHLARRAEQVRLKPGDLLFEEGDPGNAAYVVENGKLEVTKHSGGREVLLAVRQTGEVFGELAVLEEAQRMASVRARTGSTLLAIHKVHLDDLIDRNPVVARAMVSAVLEYWRNTDSLLRQNERMTQLGTLTAGVAHELNNPAAAVKRSAVQLEETITSLEEAYERLARAGVTPEQQSLLRQISERELATRPHPARLDPMERSDLEYELELWLEEKGVMESWDCAPTLIDLGYRRETLEGLAGQFNAAQLAAVIPWITASHQLHSLGREISQAASRISTIVDSLKDYAFLDQAPLQEVDIHEGLDNTLLLLNHRLQDGITIIRDFSPDVPRIQAYGSELNQVWTHMLNNAIDAIGSQGGQSSRGGQGEIYIRTERQGDFVAVEICDNGPGIAEDILGRIFDPFFTTKPPGQGTGQGLNVSYNIVVHRHLGDIQVASKPGRTTFRVILPVDVKAAQSREAALDTYQQPTDDQLRDIYETTRRIAVVGMTNHADRPSFTVPAYLKTQGYEIIPVNPTLTEEVLGAKPYATLAAIPDPVDVVLVFRKSEDVMPVAEEAVAIGAKTLWMQQGIMNFDAATMARNAGLTVVMNMCMRMTHVRLMSQM
jgi:signal transduction histidine kinase/predicted CoA-binding protein